jgi:hypothetical protein
MNRAAFRYGFACAVLLAAGCDDKSPVELMAADQAGRIVVDFDGEIAGLPRDSWQLSNARIDGDTLHLRISHGGGCARHGYGLVAWNGWMESNPVQVGVVLLHESNDDPCDALLSPNLRFDLKPLRDAFVEAYGGPGGTIIINLDNPSGAPTPPAARLTYTF